MRSAPPELLGLLLDSIADAVYVVDHEGRVEFANPAALELLGWPGEALLGRPSHATIHHHHGDGTPFPEEDCPLLRPRTSGETVRAEDDVFWRRDGSSFRVAYSSAPLATAGGRGAVVVFRDVTAQLEAEEALRREAVARARAEELHASRARIVEAADAERRRLVRDLHDGAQQRLIGILLALRRAADRAAAGAEPAGGGEALASRGEAGAGGGEAGGDRGEVAALIEAAARETQGAIAELRDLGSGLHPQILTNRGVAAAVESLTGPLPLVVTLEIPERRWPAAVEAAAYYTIAEALTNVVKHAAAEAASVRVTDDGGELVVTVADDGRGGATPAPGRGLAGLRDRVEALGGRLALREGAPPRASAPGFAADAGASGFAADAGGGAPGTVLEARLPLTAAAAPAPPARAGDDPAGG
ncbi:PAS domain S-box protein [Conexibacter sp. JD483]|uniref:sensor histidine kinase n=1 Tax=unclassified Conexibacter TaxID=2627773 RepID=UPI0027166EF9|nr:MULTISPECIES: PAS domain S-box protein [unclassified Conexibacter]MDO8187325.1 PAS domain S-box protein [Conexibacter sp. CPCC 205706]MDO8200542.1 PAS domain S-box protein [Conexibacter sp. CPCC 205762]MDR9369989.1 PAS domain S-box protein [Conexibacter sp. JD483]